MKGVIYFQAIEEVYYDHLKNAHKVSQFICKSVIFSMWHCPHIHHEYCWHMFVFCFSPSICLSPSHTCTSSSLSPLSSIISLFSSTYFHYRTQEPQPLADVQCEDPRSCVLHGSSVPWGHANLDGCYCYGCWRTHAFHGVTDPNRSSPLYFSSKHCVILEDFRHSAHIYLIANTLCGAEMDVDQINKKSSSCFIGLRILTFGRLRTIRDKQLASKSLTPFWKLWYKRWVL